jgi:acyl carrier protein
VVPSRLPYLWKIVVAAAVIAVLIVAVMEIRKRWTKGPTAPPPAAPSTEGNSAIYDDTLGRVQDIISVFIPTLPEVLTPDMRLADLGIDPLTRVEVAEAIESAYHITLPTDELNKLETVDDLVRLVIHHQQGSK